MSNGNPFYVQPGTNFGPGLMGLAGTVGQVSETRKAEQRAQDEKNKIATMRQEISDAASSNDPIKIRSVMSKYPEMAKNIKAIIETKIPGESGSAYKNAVFSAAVDFSQAPQLLESLRTQFEQDGRIDPQEQASLDNFGRLLATDKEKAQKAVEFELSLLLDDDEWKRYQDIKKPGPGPLSPEGKVQSDIDKGLLTEEQAEESAEAFAPTKLTKLLAKLDTFPKGSKRAEYYQKAIDKETSGGNPDLDLILAQRIVDGKLDFNKLSRRGGQKGRIAGIIAQIAPEFSLIDAEANIKYKTDSANLRTIALIAGIEPLFEELKGKAADLNNGVLPIFNKGVNAWRLQTGDAKVVAFNNLRDDVIAEVERVLMGSGVLSDSKYMRALHNLNTAQSPEQMGAAIQQMMMVVKKRDEALRAQPYPQNSFEDILNNALKEK